MRQLNRFILAKSTVIFTSTSLSFCIMGGFDAVKSFFGDQDLFACC
jgi:hypothetical protein